MYRFPAIRLVFTNAAGQRVAGGPGRVAVFPGRLGIQKLLWFPHLVHRGSRQLREPWASRVCAGALCKTGRSPPGKPTPMAWQPRLTEGRELRFSKEAKVRLALHCCFGNIPRVVKQLCPGCWHELRKARIPSAVGQSPGRARISLAGRPLRGLAISREDKVCFQMKALVVSVHRVTVPGVTPAVQPRGSVRRSRQHCTFSHRAAVNLVRVQL